MSVYTKWRCFSQLHLPVMVPDPDVATPLWLWASQENVLVLFKPGYNRWTKINVWCWTLPHAWSSRPALPIRTSSNEREHEYWKMGHFLAPLSNTPSLSAGHRRSQKATQHVVLWQKHHASIVSWPEKQHGAWLSWRIVRERRKKEGVWGER